MDGGRAGGSGFPVSLANTVYEQSAKFSTVNKQIKLEGQRVSHVHRICQHEQNYTLQHVIQINIVVHSFVFV